MDASQWAAEDPRKRSWFQRISIFVVVPPRTGTSWLYEMLQRPAILPLTTKETRSFDTHYHRGLDWYRAVGPHQVMATIYDVLLENPQRFLEFVRPEADAA